MFNRIDRAILPSLTRLFRFSNIRFHEPGDFPLLCKTSNNYTFFFIFRDLEYQLDVNNALLYCARDSRTRLPNAFIPLFKKKLTKITLKNSNKLYREQDISYVYKTIILRNRLQSTELSACEDNRKKI